VRFSAPLLLALCTAQAAQAQLPPGDLVACLRAQDQKLHLARAIGDPELLRSVLASAETARRYCFELPLRYCLAQKDQTACITPMTKQALSFITEVGPVLPESIIGTAFSEPRYLRQLAEMRALIEAGRTEDCSALDAAEQAGCDYLHIGLIALHAAAMALQAGVALP
jgi:hypothetical protein